MKLLLSLVQSRTFKLAVLAGLAALGGCSTPPEPSSSSSAAPPEPQAISRQNKPEPSGASLTHQATTTTASDNSNLLLGNPSGASTNADNRLVERPQFALAYNKSNGGPNWVAWHLDQSDIGRVGRGDFWPDPLLPLDSQIRPNDYRGSGYDRGHQCPSGDRTISRENNDATFVMSNMLPQAASLNREVWAKLENYCRDQVRAGNELYILCGGSGTEGRLGKSKINVPAACWKIIIVLRQGDNDLSRINEATRVIAVSMPNQDASIGAGVRWASFLTTPAAIEGATGYTFFSNLSAATRQALEQKKDSGRAPRGSNRTSNDSPSIGSDEPADTFTPSTEVEATTQPVEIPTPYAAGSTSIESPRTPATAEQQAPAVGQSSDMQVWVNTSSGIYHYPGARWYGTTKHGEYMSEKDALTAGYRAAGNGQ